MLNIEITKDLEGQVIYATPVGNNYRRHNTDYIEEFYVVKVKRKYADLAPPERKSWCDSYCIKSGATQSEIKAGYGSNAGWLFFKSKEDLELHRKDQSSRQKLRRFFGDFHSHKLLSIDDIQEILEIVSRAESLNRSC